MTPETIIQPTSITGASTVWTRAQIYKNPTLTFLSMPPGLSTTARFTPEFLAELSRETCWMPELARTSYPEEMAEAVGMGTTPCPLCNNRGTLRLLHTGQTTGLPVYIHVQCGCAYPRLFWATWKGVPRRFRDACLSTLVPRSEQQAALLATMLAHPEDSYLLVGLAGSGKTHLATALYRNALALNTLERLANPSAPATVWRTDASDMLNEHQTWDLRDKNDEHSSAHFPAVWLNSISAVARAGYRPCLFLDEIDKVSPSDYRLNRLRELINCVYEASGQIVATMNISPDALAAKWSAKVGSEMGDAYCGTIIRRIASHDANGHLVQFSSDAPQS